MFFLDRFYVCRSRNFPKIFDTYNPNYSDDINKKYDSGRRKSISQ